MIDDPIPEARLTSLNMDENGLTFTMKHPIVPVMAEHLAEAFKASGGNNYVAFEIDSEELGPLELIMQRRWKNTPVKEVTRLRAGIQAFIDGDKPDRQNAKCEHERFDYEGCEQCNDEYFTKLLAGA